MFLWLQSEVLSVPRGGIAVFVPRHSPSHRGRSQMSEDYPSLSVWPGLQRELGIIESYIKSWHWQRNTSRALGVIHSDQWSHSDINVFSWKRVFISSVKAMGKNKHTFIRQVTRVPRDGDTVRISSVFVVCGDVEARIRINIKTYLDLWHTT